MKLHKIFCKLGFSIAQMAIFDAFATCTMHIAQVGGWHECWREMQLHKLFIYMAHSAQPCHGVMRPRGSAVLECSK